MEIDKDSNNNLILDNFNLEDVFKLDYKGQDINKNLNFKSFKNSMFKKYGNKGKIFHCKKDDIFFCCDCSKYPYYEGICPLCHESMCYFCSNTNKYYHSQCCLKKRTYYMIHLDTGVFFGVEQYELNKPPDFFELYIFWLIPFINLVYFIGGIHTGTFYKLTTKRKYPGHEFLNYEHYTKGIVEGHCDYFLLILAMDVLCTIFLSFCFILFNIYLTIVLLLISIPFKFYPIKCLFGLGYCGWKMP